MSKKLVMPPGVIKAVDVERGVFAMHWRPTQQMVLDKSGRFVLIQELSALALAVAAYWVILDFMHASLPPVYDLGVISGWFLTTLGLGAVAMPVGMLLAVTRNSSRWFVSGLASLLGGLSFATPPFMTGVASLHLTLNGPQVAILALGVLLGCGLQLAIFSLCLATYDVMLYGGIWAWNTYIVRRARAEPTCF